MSSLWTPGGEIPVDRNQEPAPAPEPPGGPSPEPDEAELRAEYERMQQQILEAPAADVIAQHVMSMYELAAVHLSQEEPRLDDARLVIDAVTAIVEKLSGRLGPIEAPLNEALPQLRMAFVEATDRVRARSSD